MVRAAAVVAATREGTSAALLALTSAALALPGMPLSAAPPQGSARVTTSFNHYEESDDRLQAQVYRASVVAPLTDRLELSFNSSRDTYSGATPAFNIPTTLTNQLQYQQKDDGTPSSTPTVTDVVSAATGAVTSGQLTTLGGLDNFVVVSDNRAAFTAAYKAANPPPSNNPTTVITTTSSTIEFASMPVAAYFGSANTTPQANGLCVGAGSSGCFSEDGFVIGTLDDPSGGGEHLHRAGPASNRRLQYHSDSPGIYLRAASLGVFNLDSLDFRSPIDAGDNPDSGAGEFWNIFGFSAAINPTLANDTDATSPTPITQVQVANGFDGRLELNGLFDNVGAVWIFYNGYPQTPADGKAFSLEVDNIDVSVDTVVVNAVATSAEDDAAALFAYEQALNRAVTTALYDQVLQTLVPEGTPTVQRFQPQPRETRVAQDLNFRYQFDHWDLALGAGYSDEPDFQSRFGSLNLSHELAGGLATVFGGYSYTQNDVSRSTDGSSGHQHGGGHDHGDTVIIPLDEQNELHSLSAGFSRILDRHTWWQSTLSFSHQGGYLSNPYKLVYIRGELTADEYYDISQLDHTSTDFSAFTDLEVAGIELFRERRPERRRQWSLGNRLNRHFPGIDASVAADYRYYRDDWGVRSHTVDLTLYKALPRGFTLTPRLRYYSQTSADFFAPYFLTPRADGLYSSDYRLSDFGALSIGLNIGKDLGHGINLDLGIEHYAHRGALKLGGNGTEDYADFTAYVAQAALRIDLDAAARPAPAGHAHHGGHDHGAMPPAGVMLGHQAQHAGAFMLGYRYQYSDWGGDFLRGDRVVSDETIRLSGCPETTCSARPTEMSMHMHMLDIMYAATDRLSLMLMPQLMSMDMALADLPGASREHNHGSGHYSDGLGDTLVAALYRLNTRADQQLQLALGLSLPTGSVEINFNGVESSDDPLQDYGMQLGSGTFDFRPALTYLGSRQRWHWGGQVTATLRLENANAVGYALGDQLQVSAWGGYDVASWLQGSLRAVYSTQSSIKGRYNRASEASAPVDFPSNYGGRYVDIGIGANAHFGGQGGSAYSLGVEWLQPVHDDVNGFQLERRGNLAVTLSYGF